MFDTSKSCVNKCWNNFNRIGSSTLQTSIGIQTCIGKTRVIEASTKPPRQRCCPSWWSRLTTRRRENEFVKKNSGFSAINDFSHLFRSIETTLLDAINANADAVTLTHWRWRCDADTVTLTPWRWRSDAVTLTQRRRSNGRWLHLRLNGNGN